MGIFAAGPCGCALNRSQRACVHDYGFDPDTRLEVETEIQTGSWSGLDELCRCHSALTGLKDQACTAWVHMAGPMMPGLCGMVKLPWRQGRPAGCQCLVVVRSPLLAEAGHCIDWPGGAGLVSGLSWNRVAVLGVGGGFFWGGRMNRAARRRPVLICAGRLPARFRSLGTPS